MNILVIVFCGLLATLAMVISMQLIHFQGYVNADMVRAIGSLYTKKYENAFWPGLLIKFTGGAIFSIVYALFAGVAPVDLVTPWVLVITLFFVGLFHGLAVGVILFIRVAEYHPLPQFRQAGPRVILAHVVGHVVYGITLAALFAVTQVNLHLITFGQT